MTASPMILHGMSSPNVRKILLLLEEIGRPYEFVYLDVFAGEQHRPEFRAINPNGKVPTLIDPEGPGGRGVLFESNAILIYLAERYGKAFLPDDPRRYEVLQWLMLQGSGIGPNLGQLNHFLLMAERGGRAYGLDRFGRESRRLRDVVDERLRASPWLGGDFYSVADMAAFPWLDNLAFQQMEPGPGSALAGWLQRIAARPATARAARLLGDFARRDRESMRGMSDEERDRFYNRSPLSAVGE